ncbi:hypothetical protein FOL47_010824 [Perkinsus chesapeaki]|uniref:Uncharacterized protein n=1 Tax=Perkinsus chesapeaki TaxID=330153 RepID=A0A7J6MNY2_PERCH|nr:hypothetical protein FOL47_010824 [Perkinsus chesapeaki]
MPCIVKLSVSRWKVELRSLDLGPPPIWLDDPPGDFLHLPSGSSKYANISLTLAVDNNPSWLKVEVSEAQIMIGNGPMLVYLHQNSEPFVGNAEFSLASRVPLVHISEAAYSCLRHLPHDQSFILSVGMEASFTIYGHTSRNFVVWVNTLYHGTKEGGVRGNSKIEGFLRFCIEISAKFDVEASDGGLQKITIKEAGPKPIGLLIPYKSTYV